MATIKQRLDADGKPIPFQWRAQIRLKGWPHLTRTFETYKLAKAWADETEMAMKRGTWVDSSRALETTYGDLIKSYLKEVTAKRRGEESRAAETSRLNRFLRVETDICSTACAHLRDEHFIKWSERRTTEHVERGKPGGRGQYKPQLDYKPKLRKDGTPRANAAKPKRPPKPPKLITLSTLDRELTLLERVFEQYRKKLGLQNNPVKDVPRPAYNDQRRERITEEEAAALLAELAKSKNPYIVAVVEFARVSTGRRGSLLKLEWPDVNIPKEQVLWRDIKNSKNPDVVRDHLAPLSPRAIEILNKVPRIEGDKRVFPITKDALKSAFNRAREKLGLERYRFHDQRHELPSYMGENGHTVLEIMGVTGHADSRSVERYVNPDTKVLANTLKSLEERKKAGLLAKDELAIEARLEREIAEAQAKIEAMRKNRAAE
ncbi:tyrosine-type recombinase/integrase [Dongia sp.]|uniref:tyrosine-type recombinase/integrase n=1 Tax=Dongia sp. TaxID=1977262 RepID=UPI0035AEFE09